MFYLVFQFLRKDDPEMFYLICRQPIACYLFVTCCSIQICYLYCYL